jgi:putative ABC transport system permease protein
MDRLRSDLLSAVRALKSTPATAASAVITLAVAVGLNLAMYGLVDRALLSPPPHVADPGRVYTLVFEPTGDETGRIRMTTTSYVAYEALAAQVRAASHVAASQQLSASAVVDGTQLRAEVMLVSGSYFDLLGTRAEIGRPLVPEDDRSPSGTAAAVLSHGFWTRSFGSDPQVVGRRMILRGIEFTVAGVMPAGFSGHSSQGVDLWVPFRAAMRNSPGWDRDPRPHFATIVMRVRKGESPSAAAAQSGPAVERRVSLTPIAGAAVAATERSIAYWLTGISVLVLIIGLANTATLFLVRGARRRRELQIRTALGATRGRLMTEVMMEAAVVAAIALGAALVLALWFDEAVRRVLLPSVVESHGVTPRVAGAAALAGLLALVLAAAAGAIQLPASFSSEEAAAHRGRRRARTHAILLLVQTTLSVVLVAGAALFGRSLSNLAEQDLGMNTDGVVLVQFEQGPGAQRGDLFRAALERVRSLPGVHAATPIQTIPFTGFHVIPVSAPGSTASPSVDGQLPYLIAATPELFDILGLRIVQGRRLVEADGRGAPVVVVNESMARALWPGENAVGKCIRIGFDPSFDAFNTGGPPEPPPSAPCREVIGVVRDVRQRSVVPSGIEGRLMQYFVPFSQVPLPPGAGGGPGMNGILLRASVGPESLAHAIRRVVMDGRTNVPFLNVRRYSELMERQMRPWRLGAMLLSLFGALALTLAAIGLYAAFAHSVGERRHEMAIRIAVGAEPRGVLVMVLREAARLACAGALCGCAVTILAGRWLQSLLFGTAPTDPLALGSAAGLMIAVALAATLLPARTASRSDPNSLLRAE